MVRSREDVESEETTFHPEYMNAFFGDDELVVGYQNPRIDLFFGASSFVTFMNFSHDAVRKGLAPPTPVMSSLRHLILTPDIYTHLDPFLERVERDRYTFQPFGTKIHQYTLDNSDTFEIFWVCVKKKKKS